MKIKRLSGFAAAITAITILPTAGLAAAADPTSAVDSFSDEAIVQGVLYGEGEFAAAAGIKPLDDPKAASTDVEEVQRQLLATVTRDHAETVAMATDKIRSGDPYAVDEGIRDLSATFGTALKEDYPEVSTTAVVEPQCGVICVCVAGVEIAVVGGIAVAVVAETAIGGHFVLWTKSKLWNNSVEPQDTGDLTYTDYVAKVASAVH